MSIAASAYITPGSGTFQFNGHAYELTSDGFAQQDGTNIPGGGGTSAMALANNQVCGQDGGSGTWWVWNGDMSDAGSNWVPASDNIVPPSNPNPQQSPDGTVVKAGQKGAIVDAAGNVWTITAGAQVAVNGTADAATANVVEIAYVGGAVWQTNTAGGWWFKHTPSDVWQPGSDPLTPPPPAWPPTGVVKVMPYGDSMTAGGGTAFMGGPPPGSYRWPLYELLVDMGINSQFVGDQTTNPGVLPTSPVDQTHHEGIGGYAIDLPPGQTAASPSMLQYVQQNNILATYQPHIILFLMGYNNIYSAAPANVGPAQAYQYVLETLKYFFSVLPNVRVVVMTEPAVSGDAGIPTSDPASSSELGYYNWLLLNKLSGDIANPNVSVVDLNAAEQAIGPAGLIGPDGLHPNVPATHVMGVQFAIAINNLLA